VIASSVSRSKIARFCASSARKLFYQANGAIAVCPYQGMIEIAAYQKFARPDRTVHDVNFKIAAPQHAVPVFQLFWRDHFHRITSAAELME